MADKREFTVDRVRADGLTERHREILTLVSHGMRAHDVARELSLARSTVKHHLAAAAMRLDARNTTHAVAKALRDGLID